MYKTLLTVFISIALTACASSGFTVPPEHFYGNTDAAYVTIMRKSAFAHGGANFPVEMDGKTIARIGSGDYMRVPISPGKHYFAIGESIDRSIKIITARPGLEYFLRFRIEVYADNGPLIFEKLTATKGRMEIDSGNYNQIKPN